MIEINRNARILLATKMVQELGGIHVLARAIGAQPSWFRSWVKDGKIPEKFRESLIRAGDQSGVAIPTVLFSRISGRIVDPKQDRADDLAWLKQVRAREKNAPVWVPSESSLSQF